MSKKATSVKTHYPDVIQVLTWGVVGAMQNAELSEEAVEKFQGLLQRAYSMGRRDGYEKAERKGEYYIRATGEYSQQIAQLKASLAEVFGWEWREDEWDEECEEWASAEQEEEENEWERPAALSAAQALMWQAGQAINRALAETGETE